VVSAVAGVLRTPRVRTVLLDELNEHLPPLEIRLISGCT